MTELSQTQTWSTVRVRFGALRASLATQAWLFTTLLGGLAIRLALAPFGSFQNDARIMREWAVRLTSQPLSNFYGASTVVDHLPGDLWILWLLAHVYRLFSPGMHVDQPAFTFLLKLVPALADVGIGALLYLIGRRFGGQGAGLLAAALFMFNPASIFLTSIWGQWDSVSAGVALAALWLFLRGNPEWALPVLTYAALIKPQFAALAPPFALAFLLRSVHPHTRWALRADGDAGPAAAAPSEPLARSLRRAAIAVGASVVTLLVVTLPFDVGLPLLPTRWSLLDRIHYALNYYPYTDLLAFNLWALRDIPSVTNFQNDQGAWLLGLSPHAWGNLLLTVAYLTILVVAWRCRDDRTLLWATVATPFALAMLPTRVHERYLFPTLVFAAVAVAAMPRRRSLWLVLYAALSLAYLVNLYWVYDLYYAAPRLVPLTGAGAHLVIVAASLLNLGLLLALLLWRAVPVARELATGRLISQLLAPVEAPPAVPVAAPSAPVLAAARAPSPPAAPRPKRQRRPTPARPVPSVTAPLPAPVPADVAEGPTPDDVRRQGLLPRRLNHVLPALLFAAALALYLPHIGRPDAYVYDEVYHAYTAAQYAAGNHDAYVWDTRAPKDPRHPNQGVAYEWTHPPLGKLLITGSVLIFGDNPVGWRFASAIFGALGIVVAYLLGLQVTGRRAVGLLTAGLLLVDGLYFVESRTGVVDIFVAVFAVGALLGFARYLSAPLGHARTPLLLTGTMMGLAVASKWNGVYASGLIVLVAIYKVWRLWQAAGRKRPKPEILAGLREQILWVPVALIALPAGIYLLSYGPFFLTGHSVSQFVELQRQMYYYHSHLKATHPYASSWWEWPLDRRPVYYYAGRSGDLVKNIYAGGNPFLYWAFLPAVAYVAWRWWRTRPAALLVLGIGFFGQWLPWALSPRLAFIYHFLPSVPFGCLALAVTVDDFWRRGAQWRLRPTAQPSGETVGGTIWGPVVGWRAAAIGYVGLVFFAFAFFYPIYAGSPLTQSRFDMRIWFHSWR